MGCARFGEDVVPCKEVTSLLFCVVSGDFLLGLLRFSMDDVLVGPSRGSMGCSRVLLLLLVFFDDFGFTFGGLAAKIFDFC